MVPVNNNGIYFCWLKLLQANKCQLKDNSDHVHNFFILHSQNVGYFKYYVWYGWQSSQPWMNYWPRCKQPPWLIKTLLGVELQRVDRVILRCFRLLMGYMLTEYMFTEKYKAFSGNLQSLSGESPRHLMMKWWNWQWNQAASGRLSRVHGPGFMSHKSEGTLILEGIKWLIHWLTFIN